MDGWSALPAGYPGIALLAPALPIALMAITDIPTANLINRMVLWFVVAARTESLPATTRGSPGRSA
jgi:hypothetical protein